MFYIYIYTTTTSADEEGGRLQNEQRYGMFGHRLDSEVDHLRLAVKPLVSPERGEGIRMERVLSLDPLSPSHRYGGERVMTHKRSSNEKGPHRNTVRPCRFW